MEESTELFSGASSLRGELEISEPPARSSSHRLVADTADSLVMAVKHPLALRHLRSIGPLVRIGTRPWVCTPALCYWSCDLGQVTLPSEFPLPHL